jgi:hypothetical protein
MERESLKRLSHKEWRRQVKKKRRKRLRRKAARERDEEADRLRRILEQSANYLQWLEEKHKLKEEEEKRIEEERAELEKAWLEAEVRPRYYCLEHEVVPFHCINAVSYL